MLIVMVYIFLFKFMPVVHDQMRLKTVWDFGGSDECIIAKCRLKNKTLTVMQF